LALLVALVRHQAFLVLALPMRVEAAAVQFLAHHLHLAALVGVVEAQQTLMELLVQQTQAVAAGAQTLPMTVHNTMVAQAAQASLSFHTQAQLNYLVVALLPNQALTSFTHLRLLTHLALCHLYLLVT
jgi:hypothetical protein